MAVGGTLIEVPAGQTSDGFLNKRVKVLVNVEETGLEIWSWVSSE